jgi:hypothetical protein
MAAQAIGELPTEILPSVPDLPNPVILPDMEISKSIFNDAMAAEKANPSETSEEVTSTPTKESDKTTEAAEPTKDKSDVKEDTPVIETTTSDKIETTATRTNLPEELLTGKKPEPKVDDALAELDAMVLPKNAKPEQVASFAKLKEQAKKVIEEKVGRIRELETKTGEGASRHEIEAAQERIKAAETARAELEQTIERIAFTESPRFKQFINDEAATLTSAKSYFEGTEINPEIIEYAARATGAQRIKILTEAGADASLIGAVSPYLAQYDNIQRYKTGALENWKSEQSKWVEQNNAQQQAAQEQRRKSEDDVWTQTVHELSDLVPLRKFDKNDSWNTRSEELLRQAKAVYNGDGVDLKTVAERLIKGQAYDALDEVRIALTEELNKVLGENAKLKSARPGASNGQASVSTNGNDSHLTPTQQAMARFNAEKARAAQ